MDNRTNTIAGWVLAACVTALGASIVSGMVFHEGRPEKMGYPIEGVEEAGGGGAEAAVPIATLLAAANPAQGADVFKKCTACHTINQGGANGVGPNLYATMGAPIAQGKGGYAFSEALKAKGGTWTFEAMDAWLKSPRKFADGTKMTFAGLGSATDRANIIAYMNEQGSNLPLPAAGAAPEAGTPVPDAATNEDGAAVLGNTADVSNQATLASGAPSIDPGAKERAPK